MTKQRNVFLMVGLLLASGSTVACDEADALDGSSERAWDEAKTDAGREACSAVGEARECEEGEGTQFCGAADGVVAWGECLTDFACMPGGSRECLLVDGVPMLRGELDDVIPSAGATSLAENGALDPEEPESMVSKYCYGGSGYSCCDYEVCFDCTVSPNPNCCYYYTACESP